MNDDKSPEKSRPILRPFYYQRRLIRYTSIPRDFFALMAKGDLTKQLFDLHMAEERMVIKDLDSVLPEMDMESRSEFEKQVKKRAEDEISKVIPIICNQAMVMACTIFDVFLVETLETILKCNKNAMQALAYEKDIDIHEFLDLDNKEQCVDTIRGKILRRFDYLGLNEKLERLGKIGLDIGSVFKLPHLLDHVRIEFPNPQQSLNDLYNNRHDIVHRDKLPYTNTNEVSRAFFLLNHIMMEIAISVGMKWKIEIDLFLLASDINDPRIIWD